MASISYKPLYLQVREILLSRIDNGMLSAREMIIPSESVLAEEFGTSISTIRQAVSMLAADGITGQKAGQRYVCLRSKDDNPVLGLARHLTISTRVNTPNKLCSTAIEAFQKQLSFYLCRIYSFSRRFQPKRIIISHHRRQCAGCRAYSVALDEFFCIPGRTCSPGGFTESQTPGQPVLQKRSIWRTLSQHVVFCGLGTLSGIIAGQ